MTSHCITWHDTTQAITSHQMTWPSHDLTPQQTLRHRNASLQSTRHHHHGTAKGSFTAKTWFGHRAGRSPCAHSIGKFFLSYIVLFLLETSAPGLSGHYWYMALFLATAKFRSSKVIWPYCILWGRGWPWRGGVLWLCETVKHWTVTSWWMMRSNATLVTSPKKGNCK